MHFIFSSKHPNHHILMTPAVIWRLYLLSMISGPRTLAFLNQVSTNGNSRLVSTLVTRPASLAYIVCKSVSCGLLICAKSKHISSCSGASSRVDGWVV